MTYAVDYKRAVEIYRSIFVILYKAILENRYESKSYKVHCSYRCLSQFCVTNCMWNPTLADKDKVESIPETRCSSWSVLAIVGL